MGKQLIQMEPISRIEGSLKVIISLDAAGNVERAKSCVPEFRGFERFLVGRHVSRVPLLTPRICGVCPVPHHLASAKAIEAGLGIAASETVDLLRELMLTVEHVGDHVLHMFLLAGPDILLPDLAPDQRGLPALYERHPEALKSALAIRLAVQRIVSALAVQPIHPATWVPGGITRHFDVKQRDQCLRAVEDAKARLLEFHDVILLPELERTSREHAGLGRIDTAYVGLNSDGTLNLYDGVVRAIDSTGALVGEFAPADYLTYIVEQDAGGNYAKQAYIKLPNSAPTVYRTGPIASLNLAKSLTTEHAEAYLKEFRSAYGEVAQDTQALNVARYICTVYAIERAEQLLADPRIIGDTEVAPTRYQAGTGVGIVEAARGLLIHHFSWDDDGYITMANIITPTNANAFAIDTALTKVAARSIHAGQVNQTQLDNEIGLTVRAYDPCLSCATHAIRPDGADSDCLRIEIVRAQQ